MIYPELIKKVLHVWLVGLFAAVVIGAVLSTFNSVLNSAATVFSIDVYNQLIDKSSSDITLIKIGKLTTSVWLFFRFY